MKKQIHLLIVILLTLIGCESEIHMNQTSDDTFVQPVYFGDVNIIKGNDALAAQQNTNAKTLLDRIRGLRNYMGENQLRLSIKPWHDIDSNYAIVGADSLNSTNSLSSFDGVHHYQVATVRGRDYFWKTDVWFFFYGIADTVVQTSDQLKGHHGFLPSSVDNFYDNINWYKTADSLVLTIKRSTDWGGRTDESLWLNTKTNSGKFYYWNREGSSNADIYVWNADGSGTYVTQSYQGVITPVDAW